MRAPLLPPESDAADRVDLGALLVDQHRMLIRLSQQLTLVLRVIGGQDASDGGPTAVERQMAELVSALREQTAALDRLDARTAALGNHLPHAVGQAVAEALRQSAARH